MKLQICVNNRVLSEGLKKIIADHLPGATLGDHWFGPRVDDPALVLFTSLEDILPLKQAYPQAKFICFDHGSPDCDLACLLYCHGVCGIISPQLDIAKFGKALKKVHGGEVWLDQKHLHLLLERGAKMPNQKPFRTLSEQDHRIVQMVASGDTNKEIACKLCLSLPTIKTHLSRIFRSLNVENRSQLAALATKSLNHNSLT